MSNLLDLLRSWANKLTSRILVIAGTSPESLKNWEKAVKSQDEGIIERDRGLNTRVPLIRFVLFAGAAVLVLVILKQLNIIK